MKENGTGGWEQVKIPLLPNKVGKGAGQWSRQTATILTF